MLIYNEGEGENVNAESKIIDDCARGFQQKSCILNPQMSWEKNHR